MINVIGHDEDDKDEPILEYGQDCVMSFHPALHFLFPGGAFGKLLLSIVS